MNMNKKSSQTVLLLSFSGALVLIAGTLYFNSPLFGWVISILIFLIFVGSELRTYRGIQRIENEQKMLSDFDPLAESNHDHLSLVGARARFIRKLEIKKIQLSAQTLSDILDSRENLSIGKSNGGVVILLGLLGTFFGLMLSISTAGEIIEINSDPQNILDTIQSIFSSMKGIFGTSLCGLFASLVLNASHSVLVSRHDSFMADLDEFTLLELLPAASKTSQGNEEQVMSVVESMTLQMEEIQRKSLETLRNSVSEIANAIGEFKSGISGELSSLFKDFSTQIKLSQVDLVKSVQETQAGAAGDLKIAITSFGEQFSETLRKQAESVLEQWKKTEVYQQKGLDVLATSSEKMIESALLQTNQFSESAAGKMNQFFDSVYQSFSEFSSSSQMLISAQKALMEEMEKRTLNENESSEILASNISEAASLMRVNQSEFSATLEMFRQGTELILEKLSGNTEEQQNEQNFLEQLQLSLESFQDRAGEILVENALKTQEILLEILEQSQRPISANEVKSDA